MSPAPIRLSPTRSIMYIASRNQVDVDEFGGGYVNGWDQARFAADIKKAADEVGYAGDYYLCRDHGGPCMYMQ